MRERVIAVDFDGTIVTHEYPQIGLDNPGAVSTILELQQAGHRIILLTMRSGKCLEEAVQYLKNNGVIPWAVNENPEQHTWTSSGKVYANIYIDDAALGCPLRQSEMTPKPFVDWERVRTLLLGDVLPFVETKNDI